MQAINVHKRKSPYSPCACVAIGNQALSLLLELLFLDAYGSCRSKLERWSYSRGGQYFNIDVKKKASGLKDSGDIFAIAFVLQNVTIAIVDFTTVVAGPHNKRILRNMLL